MRACSIRRRQKRPCSLKKSHHRNTSVLYFVQNLFPKNKESRTISLNSHYMVVFKNPRDASQMSHLARQMYPGRVQFVQEAFKDATYRTAIYWSISNRTRPRTCVCARPSFQTTVFSTCTCRRYKKTARVDSLFIGSMSDLVKRHIVCIQALNRIKSNKLKRAIIVNADADLLCALAQCAYNILKKNIPLSELQRRRLSKYRTKLASWLRDERQLPGEDASCCNSSSARDRAEVSYRPS